MVLIGSWCLFPFVTNMFQQKLIWARLVYISAILTPPAFLHFSVRFSSHKKKFGFELVIISYIISFAILLYVHNIKFINAIIRLSNHYTIDPGPIFHLFVIYFGIVCFYSFLRIYDAMRNTFGYRRNQLKYILIGFLFAYLGGILHFAPIYFEINEIIPHDTFIIIFSLLITYAIVKHHLMNIEIVITRAGLFLVVYTLILGIPFWIGFHIKIWLIPTLLMFALATSGPIIYRYLQIKAENILLAKQRYYQKALIDGAKGMIKEHDLNKLLKFVTDIIKWTVNIEFVGIFLKDKEINKFTLKKIAGYKKNIKDIDFLDTHPLIKLIKKKKRTLIFYEIDQIINKMLDKPIHSIVPLYMENSLLGFLVLGEKKDRTFYTEDDINVFEILARQAVLAIDHCIFMEEFSKAQEKVFEAEKLASIGGMADGVAHQIKNRLNFFSIVSGEIKSEADEFLKKNCELVDKNPELKTYLNYVSEIGNSLINNVRKTNNIIEGILSFARTGEKGTFFSLFSLKEIINTALGLLLVKHHINDFPLEIEIESSDIIYGVKSQLLECIYNILDNCYEAIKEKVEFHLKGDENKNFKPIITLRLEQNKSYYFIKIVDNGIGIKDENKKKIFAPFFTTKPSNKSGTGIGMYVVKRIVEENHKGSVSFESEYMKGTKFYIKIPKNDSTKVVARMRKSDLVLQNQEL